ncbi:ABC transporter substrate-binding protein [Pasteurellaceae bacterium USgator11]|nr:ABC transporter substrate-binding protein [Pasteurellaceae bacterium USgator11]
MRICHFFIALVLSLLFQVKAETLTIGTTLSVDSLQYLIDKWQEEMDGNQVKTVNRTAMSLERLLMQPNEVDIIFSSSPILLYNLKENNKLAILPKKSQQNNKLIPEYLTQYAVAVAFSGFGILYNEALLKERGMNLPTDWQDLLDIKYNGSVVMSSPSRSGTTHLLIEMLLQQQGWKSGWATILEMSSNLSTISSRSFGVAEKLKSGLVYAGLTIDNYANLALKNKNLGFQYFPNSIASATFLAINKNSQHKLLAENFIDFLLSEDGQKFISNSNNGKFPVNKLPEDHLLFYQQQRLLDQDQINHKLLLERRLIVEKLFDLAITFRLKQLQDTWNELYKKEEKLGYRLQKIRDLLTSIPISESDINQDFLLQIKGDQNFLLKKESEWIYFFQNKNDEAIKELGKVN